MPTGCIGNLPLIGWHLASERGGARLKQREGRLVRLPLRLAEPLRTRNKFSCTTASESKVRLQSEPATIVPPVTEAGYRMRMRPSSAAGFRVMDQTTGAQPAVRGHVPWKSQPAAGTGSVVAAGLGLFAGGQLHSNHFEGKSFIRNRSPLTHIRRQLY